MNQMEKARALREDSTTHYNCAQAVVMAWSEECGLSDEVARSLSAHFGGGMRHGSTCGAVTGALMVLGLMGRDEQAARALMNEFRNKNRYLDCGTLLQEAADNGEDRKSHCDRVVYDAMAILEEFLKG